MMKPDIKTRNSLVQLSKFLWWQKGIIYQIYPRSFMDSNGDGIGDLPGILERLDYLKWLGVDAIWISPIYPSPMADFGYDISDYQAIHPDFGTMKDFDELLEAAHQKGLRLILDLVPNHTSDQHPWFLESRSSRDNPKRNWYLWKDAGPDGGVPNNWLSCFGGVGWEWDEKTEQYYYHAYLKEQPDLNWRNPEVQEAMFNIMRFWLRKGVDGFRVDVMWHMIKDDQWRNNPVNPHYTSDKSPYDQLIPAFSVDQPEVHGIVSGMRKVMDEFEERVLIGEIYLPIPQLVTYYGEKNSGAHLPFNFQLLTSPWNAREINAAIDLYEGALPLDGWPNWVLGNHDKSRIVSRIGIEQARVAAMLLLTLRGTPTLYYGDELGMENVTIPSEFVQDPWEKNVPGKGLGRDPARTPMLWDSNKNSGFSKGNPWLPLSENYQLVNVEMEKNDPQSFLSLYHSLIKMRKREPALSVGDFNPVPSGQDLIVYRRMFNGSGFLIALNLGENPEEVQLTIPDFSGVIMMDTSLKRKGEELRDKFTLQGNEGLVIKENSFRPNG